MPRPLFIVALVLAITACAPTYHRLELVNRTRRTIEEVYVYPAGAANQGNSRARLAPDQRAEVKVKAGNVEVRAVSEPIQIDATTRDTMTATQTVELKGPLELVFHDSDQTPAGLDRPGTLGVTFRIPAPAPAAEPAAEDGPAGP